MREARTVLRRLRAGEAVGDLELDQLYPEWVRRASDTHWTPCEVARRAAALLVSGPETRVLDVGSGPGKFCLIGALTTPGEFIGVEQRADLVEIAEETAARCEVPRVRYVHANITSLDWRGFDAFYLYNPFYEHIADGLSLIDDRVEHDAALFHEYVAITTRALQDAPVHTRVATYQGFGGQMPPTYRLHVREPAGDAHLELWVKEAAPLDTIC